MTSYRHRCTTRKLTRITISITRHSILTTARGQFHTSFISLIVSGRYPGNPAIWAVFSYLLTTVMVTNYAKRRVKLRIERAKFQFVLIVFCNRAVLLFNFLIKKTMDSDESYHSESEFYNPNEKDKENNAVRLYFRFII